MRDTGSAELDHILAERKRIHAAWRAPRRAIPPPRTPIPAWLIARLPQIPIQKEKPLKKRIAEAMDLRGTISEHKLRFIINAIYGSARDRGEYLVDESFREAPLEIVVQGELSTEKIKTVVAEHFNLTKDELLCIRQCVRIALPRHIAMYLSKLLIQRSLAYIGKQFGSDHSAITHAAQKIERLMAKDAEFAEEIKMLREMLS